MRITRERVRKRLEPVLRIREEIGAVSVYVRDDDKLRSVGEDFELVGTYTRTAPVAHIVDDVMHWYHLTHPAGRGRQ